MGYGDYSSRNRPSEHDSVELSVRATGEGAHLRAEIDIKCVNVSRKTFSLAAIAQPDLKNSHKWKSLELTDKSGRVVYVRVADLVKGLRQLGGKAITREMVEKATSIEELIKGIADPIEAKIEAIQARSQQLGLPLGVSRSVLRDAYRFMDENSQAILARFESGQTSLHLEASETGTNHSMTIFRDEKGTLSWVLHVKTKEGGKFLGEGGQGSVKTCINLQTGEICAEKVLVIDESNPDQAMHMREGAKKEQAIAQRLKGVEGAGRILFSHEYTPDPKKQPNIRKISFIMPLNARDLENVAAAKETKQERCRVATEVCDAVADSHAKGVVFGDLKPQNAMLDQQSHVVLIDFGLCTALDMLPEEMRVPDDRDLDLNDELDFKKALDALQGLSKEIKDQAYHLFMKQARTVDLRTYTTLNEVKKFLMEQGNLQDPTPVVEALRAQVIRKKMLTLYTVTGTAAYHPPEVSDAVTLDINKETLEAKDVFACGLISWKLLKGTDCPMIMMSERGKNFKLAYARELEKVEPPPGTQEHVIWGCLRPSENRLSSSQMKNELARVKENRQLAQELLDPQYDARAACQRFLKAHKSDIGRYAEVLFAAHEAGLLTAGNLEGRIQAAVYALSGSSLERSPRFSDKSALFSKLMEVVQKGMISGQISPKAYLTFLQTGFTKGITTYPSIQEALKKSLQQLKDAANEINPQRIQAAQNFCQLLASPLAKGLQQDRTQDRAQDVRKFVEQGWVLNDESVVQSMQLENVQVPLTTDFVRLVASNAHTDIASRKAEIQKGIDALVETKDVDRFVRFLFSAHPELQRLGFRPFQIYLQFVKSLPPSQRDAALRQVMSLFRKEIKERRGDTQRSMECVLSFAAEMGSELNKETEAVSDAMVKEIFSSILDVLDFLKEHIPTSERQSLLRLYIDAAAKRGQEVHTALYIDLEVAPDVIKELQPRAPEARATAWAQELFGDIANQERVKSDKQMVRQLGGFFSRSIGHFMQYGGFGFKECFETCQASMQQTLSSLQAQGVRTQAQNKKQVAAFVQGSLEYLRASLVRTKKIDATEWQNRLRLVSSFVNQSVENESLKPRNAFEFYESAFVEVFKNRTDLAALKLWKAKFEECLQLALNLGLIDEKEANEKKARIEYGKPILRDIVDPQLKQAANENELFQELRETVQGYMGILPSLNLDVNTALQRARGFVGSIKETISQAHLPLLKGSASWSTSVNSFFSSITSLAESGASSRAA